MIKFGFLAVIKLMVLHLSVSYSVHRRAVSAPLNAGIHTTARQTPPGQTPLGKHTPGQTPSILQDMVNKQAVRILLVNHMKGNVLLGGLSNSVYSRRFQCLRYMMPLRNQGCACFFCKILVSARFCGVCAW